jgi:hypothetical protein
MERAKYLSADDKVFYKFEGLGRYGKEVARRSQQLAEAGFSPRLRQPLDAAGYVGYERIDGHSLGARHSARPMLSEEVLQNLARYCAFRGKEFACEPRLPLPDEISIVTMCEVNAQKEFGVDLETFAYMLPCERPAITDARMMPHEWRWTESGGMMKTDGASHGDDHFFPGPCDIAWDLAGAIVEWGLSGSAADFFLEAYRRASGDDVSPRIHVYLLAYTLFRMGYCKMALEAMQGSGEECRLRTAFGFYRELAGVCLERCGFAIASL